MIDTGGWYKLCCPTSQLAKPDIPGAIYRIRMTGAAKIDYLRGLKLDWNNPKADWLDDPRPAVRKRAIGSIAAPGDRGLRYAERAETPEEI